MALINLLPWRELERKKKRREFIVGVVIVAAVAVVILIFIHIYVASLQNYQTQRNALLTNEINLQAVKLAKITDLETQKQKLINKIKVIQGLERYRFGIIHVLDALTKVVPDGIYLTKFTQSGDALQIKGKSHSNAQISRLMQSVENSLWLKIPQLQIIQSVAKQRKEYVDDFSVNLKQFHNLVD
ncbi:MAG TPA: pilus assembly protein PilN [Methylococcaceae bacterium]|jgi:type IV pilus assembly protein PilN|nr:pilus assembly protein PilN [Methylococcaceae bacterium]HIN68276.1 pilus assembly protein PilN [Methylococcales bacterium]HIA44227.1 pilus assembly protein PilN [Methylococcaceae bacterium]HIB63479.1 pilus assembly protein PilN [Methylococcaceae bacterium]HIO12604.1 pilus assembly protein PilN [Methylococcales bacterium]